MGNNKYFDPGTIPEPSAGGPVPPMTEGQKKNTTVIIVIVVVAILLLAVLPVLLLLFLGFGIFGLVSSHLEDMDSLECRANSSYMRIYYSDSSIDGFVTSGGVFKDDLESVRDYVQSTHKPIKDGLADYGRKVMSESHGVAKCYFNSAETNAGQK